MSANTIVITGATGRIGQTLTNHFLQRGNNVVATCFSDDSFRAMSDRKECGETLFPVQLNLLDKNSTDSLISFLKEKNLEANHLINNARSLETMKSDDNGRISLDNFSKEMHLQVIVPYELTMSLIENFGSSFKSVINVGSQYGVVAVHHSLSSQKGSTPAHYSVAKAAVVQLTKELAVRLAGKGVKVNCVSLGGVGGRAPEDFVQKYEKLVPSGRMLEDVDLPGPFEFLISDASSGMSGHNLVVDGGWSIV